MFCRYKPVDHKLILLPLREAFEDLFSQTYSRKQNLTFLGHVQTCFRGKRWQDLLKLMDHVCKSALTQELQEKSNGRKPCHFQGRKLLYITLFFLFHCPVVDSSP